MFNSQLIVIDPINFVPMVLLTRAMTLVGKMHERFSLVERIISSPCRCLFNILCGKDGHQGKDEHQGAFLYASTRFKSRAEMGICSVLL